MVVVQPNTRSERPLATLGHSRSRQTRRDIIAAAIQLSETRSFDDVTVDEIIAMAGVAKGTFYYHFRRKEDVLVELAWTTVDRVGMESEDAYANGASMLQALDLAMNGLTRRINAMPPGAVARTLIVAMVNREPEQKMRKRARYGFMSGVLEAAQRNGEIAASVDVPELTTVLSHVIAETILDHVGSPTEPLNARLQRRARLVLFGMDGAYPTPLAATVASPRRRKRNT